MAVLTKDQLLKVRYSKTVIANIEAMGGDVRLRLMSLQEFEDFTAKSEGLSSEKMGAMQASYFIANEDGTRMFEGFEEILDHFPVKAVTEICEAGAKYNGISDDDVEEEAKNY